MDGLIGREGERACITNEMEMQLRGRRSTGGGATPPDTERAGNLVATTGVRRNPETELRHPRERSVTIKVFNKVQVVYYLTRNGHLQHPHYLEVSHLVTQPLRLRDVIDRLAVLRGKAMPSQYSWSCKRSYKKGYVWNDLTESDVIYASSEGSEYVLKGSELIQPPPLFENNKAEELQIKVRQQGESSHVKQHKTKYGSVKSKSHQSGHSFRRATSTDQNEDDEEKEGEEEEEEEEASCNMSSNAQMEQEETYSLPSTSSTNSDKHQRPPPPLATPPEQMKPIPTSESKQLEEKTGNPSSSSSALSRNPVLLQLIACGGGSVGGAKEKPRSNPKGGNVRNFNFNTMSSIMPCLKQQLSTRSKETHVKVICNNRPVPPLHHHDHVGRKDEDDEDMMMVRYISENPRFGNLQSEEKEYFSGTIIETMTAHQQHTPLAHSQDQTHLPVFTKSSSYNEQRSYSAGLQEAAAAAAEEDDKGGVKLKGFIKCIPRKKSCSSTCSKSNRF